MNSGKTGQPGRPGSSRQPHRKAERRAPNLGIRCGVNSKPLFLCQEKRPCNSHPALLPVPRCCVRNVPCPTTKSAPSRLPSRSEEHTSELQSLMRISYAVFCLKKKIKNTRHDNSKKSSELKQPQHHLRN